MFIGRRRLWVALCLIVLFYFYRDYLDARDYNRSTRSFDAYHAFNFY